MLLYTTIPAFSVSGINDTNHDTVTDKYCMDTVVPRSNINQYPMGSIVFNAAANLHDEADWVTFMLIIAQVKFLQSTNNDLIRQVCFCVATNGLI